MHSHHHHREHQVSHRRVHKILQHEPAGAKEHFHSDAFSKVTSKTAAEHHDAKVSGKKAPKRYARGGKVKHGHQTNIAIVVPHRPAGNPAALSPAAGPTAGPASGPPPMAGPAPSPMAGPPGMPMRARGGKVADGESTRANIRKMGDRAAKNSLHPKGFFRGGAASGVGREEKAEHMKRKGK